METKFTVCQCNKCGKTFNYEELKDRECPYCGKDFRILKLSNSSDDMYLYKLSIHFND